MLGAVGVYGHAHTVRVTDEDPARRRGLKVSGVKRLGSGNGGEGHEEGGGQQGHLSHVALSI
jgi:hypothetical protein